MPQVLEPHQSTVDDQPATGTRLATPRLKTRDLIIFGVTASGLVLALELATDSAGVASFVIVSLVVYTIGQTVLSLLVEGRRRALDRLCTTVMYAGISVAVLPLLLIVWYTLRQGIRVLDFGFVTHSMFRVNPEHLGGASTTPSSAP
jgi:phosphate transport system permease protein